MWTAKRFFVCLFFLFSRRMIDVTTLLPTRRTWRAEMFLHCRCCKIYWQYYCKTSSPSFTHCTCCNTSLLCWLAKVRSFCILVQFWCGVQMTWFPPTVLSSSACLWTSLYCNTLLWTSLNEECCAVRLWALWLCCFNYFTLNGPRCVCLCFFENLGL